jgi:dTDP-4-dehydrorhamnose reductase
MKSKVLILGSSGMAGHVIKSYLERTGKFNIFDVSRSNKYATPKFLIDITDFSALESIIQSNEFDYIINCVGILNQISEENPDVAILVNSYLPHFLEKITKSSKAKIIHLSTDCVFSGKRGNYIESDYKDGLGYYGQSKALGEISNNKDLTIRTSIIGPDLNVNGVGLFNWFINQKGKILGYSNAYWSGVTTIELAKFISDLLIKRNSITGVIHLTNNSKISKYELLLLIKKVFNLSNITIEEYSKYHVDKSLVTTRQDFTFGVPSYETMIEEMKYWIDNRFV